MPTNKLTIVPVKLDALTNETSSNHSPKYHASPGCVIKTATAEIPLFNGTIQTIMKELNSR